MDAGNRLKWTLLATLGWSSVACGGTTEIVSGSGGDGGDDATGGTTTGGTSTGGAQFSGGRFGAGGNAAGGTLHTGGQATGGTVTMGGAGGTTNTGGARGGVPCSSPKELTTDDGPTGFVLCEEGYRHRVVPVTCENHLDPDAGPSFTGQDGELDECAINSDCDDEKAYCRLAGEQLLFSECVQGCTEDADCGQGYVCECGALIGTCRPSECTTDDDCDPGQLCANDDNPSCGSVERFSCTSPEEECLTASDCSNDLGGQGCSSASGTRECVSLAVCGRPFLVRGVPRQAPLLVRDEPVGPEVEGLSPAECREVQQHFLRAAQMEHASVAAFARFALQLMSLGAPLELVESCTQAQADEARHTRACLDIAHRYGGPKVSLGSLSLQGALEETTFEGILRLCVFEGCIGESTAALEATEAAKGAIDEQLKSALASIAEDELRHAALAFRFVAWALAERPEWAPRVAAWFDEHQEQVRSAEPASTPVSASRVRLRAHGVLAHRDVRNIAVSAAEQLIAPCRDALFARLKNPASIHDPMRPSARA